MERTLRSLGAPPVLGAGAHPPSRRSPRVRCAGRAAAHWVNLLALAAIVGWVWKVGASVRASGWSRIDLERTDLEIRSGWTDPRWETEVSRILAEVGTLDCEDAPAIARLGERLGALPFVAEVGGPHVLWPDGLRIDLRFREPIACIRVGKHFLPIARDATVLPGRWPAPPRLGPGYLPVLGPLDPGTDHLIPGDVLARESLRDALDVAESMADHLGPEDLQRLDRIVIDARRARATSPTEPGTRLLLVGAREVWFGRTPYAPEPGSLPARMKWSHLARALADLEGPAGLDWDLCDVRWDRAELRPRGGAGSPR